MDSVRTEDEFQLQQLNSFFNETSKSIEDLNPESQKAWETANDGTEAVDFNQLVVFLDNRIRSLVLVERSQCRHHTPEREQQIFLTEKNRSLKNVSLYHNEKFKPTKSVIQYGSVRNKDQ